MNTTECHRNNSNYGEFAIIHFLNPSDSTGLKKRQSFTLTQMRILLDDKVVERRGHE